MILVLGGTTEGRTAVKVLEEAGKPYYYSTKEEWQELSCVHAIRISGGMTANQMISFCKEHNISLLIDAAHPFASALHANVATCAEELGLTVLRVERNYPERSADIIWCDDYNDAMLQLQRHDVTNLLALTGVNTVAKLKPYWERQSCWFRVLDREQSRQLAMQQGFPSDRLVFYDPNQEEELIINVKPDALLTKESGTTGGFERKVALARKYHIKLFAIKRPTLPNSFIPVKGEVNLRKLVEKHLPDFFPLHIGFTTGTCATAATQAALHLLMYGDAPEAVYVTLPRGEEVELPIKQATSTADSATAIVIKDAGDDPDITNGIQICSTVSWRDDKQVHFMKGEGVGTITLPGIGIPIGEPAINKVPREMMVEACRAVTDRGVNICIEVPEGQAIAARTFNPKLGIVGGISIIGTSGIVRPFSSEAFVEAIRREVEVCKAMGCDRLVINSGAKSERYLKALFPELPQQAFVHYGNFIGDTLRIAVDLEIPQVSMGVMIGKAVKLAEGHLNTHSKEVVMNKAFLKELAIQAGCSEEAVQVIDNMNLARQLWKELTEKDANKFFASLLNRCREVCAEVIPSDRLTIYLIDESGNIIGTENRKN